MKPIDKKLLKVFNRLAAPERDMLVAFAEFLDSRGSASASEPVNLQPVEIPRPEDESVVAAIKRLKNSYHMLESRLLLDEASMLMTQHVMQGREKDTVIDELEVLFRRHFDKFMAEELSVGET